MKRLNLFMNGLTALMMAFAVVMLYSCGNGNKKTVEENKNLKQDDRGIINGHKYVELAGIKWATENVGAVSGVEATNRDDVYGYYYTQENAKKAAASWGSTWTLPSDAQWQKLYDECEWEWKEDYYFGGKTMNGYIVSDKYDSSKSIFLPAAGIYDDGRNGVNGQGDDGFYWSTGNGRCLVFDGGDRGMYYNYPNYGMSVRPVVAEGQSSSTTQTEQSSSTTEIKIPGQINGHAYVELAGIKVATENVGAVNGVEAKAGPAAEDNVWGCYYYTQENAKKAAESWGGTWKLPSDAQWQKLIDECNWEWKEDYYFGGKTMNGYIVSDKYDSSKSIFLPAAGIYGGGYRDVLGQGSGGYYWSTDSEGYLDFGDGDRLMNYNNPFNGMTVRPVVAEGQSSSTTQTEQSSSTTEIKIPGQINGHAYVELAGIKVATENVGAVNGVEAKAGPAAEDNVWGCYYYTQDDAEKAAASWGGTWKLPSDAQWRKLIDECEWEWKEDYYFGGKTMNGYIVSDKYDSSKSIFLPAAGIYYDGRLSVYGQGSRGYYWSPRYSSYLYFSIGFRFMYSGNPDNGITVRPVSE